jgi:DNA replication protein DnaC
MNAGTAEKETTHPRNNPSDLNLNHRTAQKIRSIDMLHEQTHEKLIAMKIFGMANALKDRLERRDHQDLSKTEFLGLLVDDEWLYRENRKLTARMRVAKFKLRTATVEAIDYATPRGLRKDQILELTQNRWLRAHESLLITGPSGSGKSFIAQALGQHACRTGFTVQYLRMPALFALFVEARAQGTYDRLLKRLAKTALLILDDLGLGSLTEQQKQDLLEAIEERHGVGATIVTSQLSVADWHEYLGAGRIAEAILDRIIHNAHRIEVASKDSMRKDSTRKKQPDLPHAGQSDI